jgi:hypothetical protein
VVSNLCFFEGPFFRIGFLSLQCKARYINAQCTCRAKRKKTYVYLLHTYFNLLYTFTYFLLTFYLLFTYFLLTFYILFTYFLLTFT